MGSYNILLGSGSYLVYLILCTYSMNAESDEVRESFNGLVTFVLPVYPGCVTAPEK